MLGLVKGGIRGGDVKADSIQWPFIWPFSRAMGAAVFPYLLPSLYFIPLWTTQFVVCNHKRFVNKELEGL